MAETEGLSVDLSAPVMEYEVDKAGSSSVADGGLGVASLNDSDEPLGKEEDRRKGARRLCRVPGCERVVKSQGCCQRHGAQAKRCKVDGCTKQAQGTHNGMCKRHWKEANQPTVAKKIDIPEPHPMGVSVYDNIIPQSIAYKPNGRGAIKTENASSTDEKPAAVGRQCNSWDGIASPPKDSNLMPLVRFLREGRLSMEEGWHRHEERRARGALPLSNLSVQLESWERQLALVELLLLSGGTPHANFKDLAYAWGREVNFHLTLARTVCVRRGQRERKRRSESAARPPDTSEVGAEPNPEAAKDDEEDNPQDVFHEFDVPTKRFKVEGSSTDLAEHII